MKLNRIKNKIITVITVIAMNLYFTAIAFGGGITDSKFFTGTKLMLEDILKGGSTMIAIAGAVGVLICGLFLIGKEQHERKIWTTRLIMCIVGTVIGVGARAFLDMFVFYY